MSESLMQCRSTYREILRGKSVFVTGHTGFKGSWLCLWLQSLGARVTGYALAPPTEPNLFTVCRVERCLEQHHEADIRNEPRLLAALRTAQPDVILHLAAQSVVREGYRTPRETFDVNVMGTVAVLECVRKLERPCAVVAVTSDKCYENGEQVWGYRECDPMGGEDPYSASKGAAEVVIQSYRRSYFPTADLHEHGVKLASVRAGNVIGGGDAITALAEGRPVQIRNPHALRPWNHVLQALSGYLQLSARLLESDDPQFCNGWNFGPLPGNELPVREIVELLIREWGEGTWHDASDPHQPHESQILRLAIDKAMWQLGWRPRWSVQQSLRETVRWYQAYFQGREDLLDFTRQQIESYEEADRIDSPSRECIAIPTSCSAP
jgi:CDP-glucose 4,6-dehydratase